MGSREVGEKVGKADSQQAKARGERGQIDDLDAGLTPVLPNLWIFPQPDGSFGLPFFVAGVRYDAVILLYR